MNDEERRELCAAIWAALEPDWQYDGSPTDYTDWPALPGLMKAMRARGWRLVVKSTPPEDLPKADLSGPADEVAVARFWRNGPWRMTDWESADTLPLAVALAARAALTEQAS